MGTLGAIALVSGTAWTQFGAARAVFFTPPTDNAAPRQATGGASRGFFTSPTNRSAPRQTTGGAERGGLFVPPPGRSAPQRATGGGARGSFFTPSSDQPAPQQTVGGASRTNAYSTITGATGRQSMLALIPDSFYGTTLRAHPTILIYVPASSAQEAIFSLKDESRNLIYQMVVPVSLAGGVIAVDLPESAPALKVGQNYQWFFALQLDGSLTPASPFVEGWVQRLEPSHEQSQSLIEDEPIARIAALGSQGVWYDTAAELAALQVNQSDESIVQHWKELLESVGIAGISAAPIVTE